MDERVKEAKTTSLRTTLSILFFAMVTGTIVLVWLCNRFFIERYYVSNKLLALESAFVSLSDAASTNEIASEAFDAFLVRIASTDNIDIIIMDQESKMVKCYAFDSAAMQRRMWDNLLGTTGAVAEAGAGDQRYYLEETLSFRGLGFSESERERLRRQTAQIVLDTRTSTQYLEMWGSLDNGSFYLLRSPMESIRNNSRIANRFILSIGAVMIAVGLVVALYLSNRITRPLRQLTEISKRMSALDFSARYEGKDHNEIQELGENINDLSRTLEKTIRELKSANHELQNDLERRDKTQAMQREFIADVTHELKTPIALIQGYAEGLQEGVAENEEDRAFYTGVIIDEAAKMDAMVRQLLTLTQLEFGRNEVDFERFDIVELIRGCVSAAKLMIDEKGIRVNVHTESESVFVWADPFMTEEVFRNYLTNAIHHCEGEKIIDVTVTVKENRGRIVVFNTGSPIPEESIDRIWDKFYKVDKARTRAYGGSGVGLSVVRAMMELMHGPYGVQNYDNGVAFWFELETQ